MSEIRIRLTDIRAARFCSSGMRVWFERHNLDLGAFLRDGIEVERFEETGDAMALHVAAIARARVARG